MSIRRFYPALLAISMLLSLVAPNASCQAAPNPAPNSNSDTPVTLHASTNLVLTDVVVTNKNNFIHGLDQSQFHLFENGKEVAITSFEEHAPSLAPPASSPALQPLTPLPPDTYTNLPQFPPATAVNLLLLDALNTPMADQMRVRLQMIEYLKTIPPGTHLAIFTLSSRLRMVQGFTTDASLLSKALKSSKGNPQQSVILDAQTQDSLASVTGDLASFGASADAVASMQQFQADVTAYQTDQRVTMTMDAFQQLARYLNAIPGRKNLIWFSGSFPISLLPDDSLISPFQGARNYGQSLEETARLLASARVAVYPVDARGLITPKMYDASYSGTSNNISSMTGGGKRGGRRSSGGGSFSPSKAQQDAAQQLLDEQASMRQIAQDTGGQPFLNSNDLKGAIARAIDNGSSYYTLGYVPASNQLNGKFHKIEIKSLHGEYKLEYRPGYYAEDPTQTKSHATSLVAAATVIRNASIHGTPLATQIVFRATIRPGSTTSAPTAGDMASSIKGPSARYTIEFRTRLQDLFVQPATNPAVASGSSQAQLEYLILAFDADGNRLNYTDKGFAVVIKPSQFSAVQRDGLPFRTELDLPMGQVFLRLAVHDLNTDKVGSLEVPIQTTPTKTTPAPPKPTQ